MNMFSKRKKEDIPDFYYEDVLTAMLDTMELGLREQANGKYEIIDYQDAYLGGLESFQNFDSAEAVVERLDNYINDYYIEDLQEVASSLGYKNLPETEKEWVRFMDKHPNMKEEYRHEYDVMKLVSSPDILKNISLWYIADSFEAIRKKEERDFMNNVLTKGTELGWLARGGEYLGAGDVALNSRSETYYKYEDKYWRYTKEYDDYADTEPPFLSEVTYDYIVNDLAEVMARVDKVSYADIIIDNSTFDLCDYMITKYNNKNSGHKTSFVDISSNNATLDAYNAEIIDYTINDKQLYSDVKKYSAQHYKNEYFHMWDVIDTIKELGVDEHITLDGYMEDIMVVITKMDKYDEEDLQNKVFVDFKVKGKTILSTCPIDVDSFDLEYILNNIRKGDTFWLADEQYTLKEVYQNHKNALTKEERD